MNRTTLRQSIFSFVIVALTLCFPNEGVAQAPDGINFQAVARNAGGTPYSLIPIDVRLRILDGTAAVVYQETHGVTTDIFGLFDVVLGQGTVVGGSFVGITWENGPYTVQIDVDDGGGFVFVGSCQFQSVPYALYADKANMAVGDLTNVDLTGLAPGQTIVWDGTEWIPGAASSTIWSQNITSAHYDLGRVGIGTATPQATFHLTDVGTFLGDTSTVLFGNSLSGAGSKMIWHANKGAFRVGILSNPFGGYNYNQFWDYDSIGYYSFAAGYNSRAKGFGAFAFGSFGWADGSSSVAFFGNASGNGSYTFGGSSRGSGSFTVEGVAEEEGGIAMYGYTGGRYGVSIGGGTTGLGASSSREDYAIAIGWNSDARGQASIALGPSDAYGYNSFSTGWITEARGNYSSTFGYQTNSYPYASMAIGRYNLVTGDSAAWVGTDPVFMIGDGTSAANRSNSFLIQKNGQTAIGYNAPVGMLQVSSALGSLNNAGALDATHASLLLGSTTAGLAFDPNQIEVIGTGLHLNFNSPHDVYLVNGGGDVGIGNDAPLARLDVAGIGWQHRINNTDAGGGDWYIGSSATAWAAGAGKFLISPTNGSTNAALAIEGTKQVGIGNIAPTDRLHISADAGEDAMRVQIGGTTRFRIHDNGGTSLGANAAAPAAGLRVTGESRFDSNIYPGVDNVLELGTPTNRWDNVWATNGIIQTSDARLKHRIVDLNYGLATIAQLTPVSFYWIDNEGQGRKIGLIAQELQEVIPEVVSAREDPNIPLGVNYAEIVPVLIKGMQEQQAILEAQESTINQQQAEIDDMKAELEAIKALLTTQSSQP